MNRKNHKKGFGPLMILLVIAVIIVLGGGVYYASHHGSSYQEEATVNTDANVVAGTSSSGSLRDLLSFGKNVMCTIDESTATSSVSGTVYISGTMMSGDFTTRMQTAGTVESHMIRNGDTVYAWTGSQGAKMTMTNMMSASAKSNNNVNLDQKVNYKCSDWSVDNGKFTPPTSVHFTDISAMMNSSVNTGASAGASVSSQCSACASLSGNAKSQCMLALHCQ